MNGLVRSALWGVALVLTSCSVGGGTGVEVDCVQRTVFARPATGGGCQSYANTCDVPDGYVECCGGFLGGCGTTTGKKCVDDPTDTCTPGAGGADCPGICQ